MSGKHLSKENKPKVRREKKPVAFALKTALRWLIALLAAALLLLNVFTYLFTVVNYYGNGMEPTLSGGQTLLIMRTGEIDEGDIIAFYYNNKVLVRRVICSGDKQISISEDGIVSIDGETLMEDYVTEPSVGQHDISFPYRVPTGRYFVMGDNRAEAMDSRLELIGPISPDRIIGKIVFVD